MSSPKLPEIKCRKSSIRGRSQDRDLLNFKLVFYFKAAYAVAGDFTMHRSKTRHCRCLSLRDRYERTIVLIFVCTRRNKGMGWRSGDKSRQERAKLTFRAERDDTTISVLLIDEASARLHAIRLSRLTEGTSN